MDNKNLITLNVKLAIYIIIKIFICSYNKALTCITLEYAHVL